MALDGASLNTSKESWEYGLSICILCTLKRRKKKGLLVECSLCPQTVLRTVCILSFQKPYKMQLEMLRPFERWGDTSLVRDSMLFAHRHWAGWARRRNQDLFYSVSSILSTIPLCLLNILVVFFNSLMFFRELIVLFILYSPMRQVR